MPLQIHRSCGDVLTACCHVAFALPTCHPAVEQLSQFWKRLQQLSHQPREHWKAQEGRQLSKEGESASMAEMLPLNLSDRMQVVRRVLGQSSASAGFLGKTGQIFGCLCRAFGSKTLTPTWGLEFLQVSMLPLFSSAQFGADRLNFSAGGGQWEKAVSADVTRFAAVQSLLKALCTHGSVWNKMCWMSVHSFCCTRCQSLLAEMGTIALGCHTWMSTMADLLLWMQMVSKPSWFRYCQELANSYSTKLVICSYQHNRLMVFAFSL